MTQNPIFNAGFFRSLTSHFKLQHGTTTNADRAAIDLSIITPDRFQQEMLNRLRSGSTGSRQQEIDTEIVYMLSSLDPSVIPDVWYLAKDLIWPTVATDVRKSAFNLLLNCVQIQNQDSNAFYVYFNDLLTNCLSSNDKIDPNFDQIFMILKSLTDEGRFIHHYQEPFKEPLLEFSVNTLSKTNDLLKNKILVNEFFDFLIESIKSGILDSESPEKEVSLSNLISCIIKVSLKTSDKNILEKCLKSLDTIVIYKHIPKDLLYPVLEILSGSAILDLYCFDLSVEVVSHIIESFKDVNIVLETLYDILLCQNPRQNGGGEKNINSSIGSLKIMSHLTAQYAVNIDFEKLLHSFNSIVQWNKNSLNLAILNFIQEMLSSGIVLSQINKLPIWDTNLGDRPRITVLSLLDNISSRMNDNSDLIQCFKLILMQLNTLAESSQYPGSLPNLVQFLVGMPNYLSTKTSLFILTFYKVENLCSPIYEGWSRNIKQLIDVFYFDHSKDINVRIGVLKLIKDVFNNFSGTLSDDTNQKNDVLFQILHFIFDNFKREESLEILSVLGETLVDVSLSVSTDLFERIMQFDILPGFALPSNNSFAERRPSLPNILSTGNGPAETSKFKPFNQRTSKVILKSYVQIFAKCLQSDGLKCSKTYDFLIKVAHYSISTKNVDLLLIASRLLVRIRCTMENRVFLTNPQDMEGLSAAFSRNLNMRKLDNTNVSVLPTDPSSFSSNIAPSGSNTGVLDEKWTYPEEIGYIPEDTLDHPSQFLSVYNDSLSDKLLINRKESSVIHIDRWLSLVISIIEQCPHWENYSFIYTHFCPQLSNLKLFESVNCCEGIQKFRMLICDQLMLKLPSNLKIPASTASSTTNLTASTDQITKHDLQVAIVRNFTPLLSYHEIFSKQEQDQIISALLVGLSSSWEKTAIPCVHILTICCYEIPLSIKKFLHVIFTKLQTRISSPYASSHILEFLLVLSYQPRLTSNFTVDEFKRAFGICFKFIQYAHDITTVKENVHQGILIHGEELEAENKPSTEFLEISPVISIYLLNLAYDVVANWFLNMKLKDRRKLSSFIIKNLIVSQSNHGKESINHQNLSFIDLITRFTYSDLELKFNKIKTSTEHFKEDKESILSSRWVYGNGILSIDTHPVTGESLISVRRASGSSVFVVMPDESMVPYYTDQLHNSHSDEDNEEDVFTENYMLLQLVVQLDQNTSCKPTPIPKEASFERSLANIDRLPVVEFHKIGLLYIGPNQKTENQILANDKGSEEYEAFVKKLGRLIRLKDCKSFYVGGLDTENDADGEYALGWNDKILQLIFHATTLMPNKIGDENEARCIDERLSFKKRHIGNNYVNIFFDESGHTFDFNVIKTQFNFLNIVIQPHSISYPSDSRDSSQKEPRRKYKVKIHRRSGVPALFAACHFKIISEENLPTFLRSLSIIANQFAQIWHSNGNYGSNWSHRMKSIVNIKEKSSKYQEDLKSKQKKSTDKADGDDQKTSGTGQSFLDQLNSETSASIGTNKSDKNDNVSGLSRKASLSRMKNSNHYEFADTDENEFFKNLEFTSFTK